MCFVYFSLTVLPFFLAPQVVQMKEDLEKVRHNDGSKAQTKPQCRVRIKLNKCVSVALTHKCKWTQQTKENYRRKTLT